MTNDCAFERKTLADKDNWQQYAEKARGRVREDGDRVEQHVAYLQL